MRVSRSESKKHTEKMTSLINYNRSMALIRIMIDKQLQELRKIDPNIEKALQQKINKKLKTIEPVKTGNQLKKEVRKKVLNNLRRKAYTQSQTSGELSYMGY